MIQPPSMERVDHYHDERIPYRSCSISSSSVSSNILWRRRNTSTTNLSKSLSRSRSFISSTKGGSGTTLQVLTMVIVTILLLQGTTITTTTFSTTFAFSLLHNTNRKNQNSPFNLPLQTATGSRFTTKMALGGINEEMQQQRQQNATSFAPDRPFVPYLRDIERVLNNHAMIRQNSLQQQQRGSPPNNNNHNEVGNDAILFHEQQRLQQQQETESNPNMLTFYSWCNEQRRNKPSLLLYDMDGAEKCIQMIRHLQQKHQTSSKMYIPDAAYIQIMKVILQRGRLRWKRSSTNTYDSQNNNNNSVIICAADQLEELLLEYESQSPLPHSKDANRPAVGTTATTTNFNIDLYNLVLEAYAICATPRGDRQYAQRAQLLLQRMEGKTESPSDEPPSSHRQPHWLPVESYLHVLHA